MGQRCEQETPLVNALDPRQTFSGTGPLDVLTACGGGFLLLSKEEKERKGEKEKNLNHLKKNREKKTSELITDAVKIGKTFSLGFHTAMSSVM